MIRPLLILALGGLMVVAAGCQEARPQLSPTDWSALETRDVDGRREDVLRAASAVMLDRGYFFVGSDREAGLVMGARANWQYENQYRRGGGMHAASHCDTMVVWVRQVEPARSEGRLQSRLGMGGHVQDQKYMTEFWSDVERRLMGGEAAPLGTPKPTPAGGGAS